MVTDAQVLDREPFWSLGANPFAWKPQDEDADRTRDARFVKSLERFEPDQRRDPVRDILLDR